MKLGILTVFLVDPADEPLLDLYLHQIEACTTVPFTLYAAVNRLAPSLVLKLQERPYVRIIACPTTNLRKTKEHSFYLEHLVCAAVDDGAEYLVTLHPDSFPIRRGWSEEMSRRLTSSCALVTLNRIPTACLMFHCDFFRQCTPRFLLTDADRASPEFEGFCVHWSAIDHSGEGYGFTAFTRGLSMHYLPESNTNRNPSFGIVYDHLIFHLVGVAGIGLKSAGSLDGPLCRREKRIPLFTLARRLHASLGPSSRRLIQRVLPERLRLAIGAKVYSEATARPLFEEAKKRLLDDPQAYWTSLTAER